jgi:hypothetical protein
MARRGEIHPEPGDGAGGDRERRHDAPITISHFSSCLHLSRTPRDIELAFYA